MRILVSFINIAPNYLDWLFSFLMQVVCLGVIPFLLYKLLFKGSDIKAYLNEVRVKPKINPVLILIAFAVGLLMFLLNIIFSNIIYTFLNIIGYTYPEGVGTIYSNFGVFLMDVLVTAIMPAIFEEICDRGLLLACLDNERNESKKMLIVGVMFGLVHQNIAQFGMTAVIGYVLAFMAIKCKSLIPSMIVHFMNNFIIVLNSYSNQTTKLVSGAINNFASFAFSSMFTLFLITAALIGLTYASLKIFGIISKEPINKSETPRDIQASQNEVNASEASANEVSVIKANKLDYAFIILSASLAGLTTLFTFVWGVLR
jgi:membrane protease YdiL (CAAX protease family)